ncbi:hypothetical protein [Streptomyces venezuelae]|uniref:hypothetical protein n=1 Tax=Streptomyces venezuelae TaxID=54571 RepID=UPI00343723EF
MNLVEFRAADNGPRHYTVRIERDEIALQDVLQAVFAAKIRHRVSNVRQAPDGVDVTFLQASRRDHWEAPELDLDAVANDLRKLRKFL